MIINILLLTTLATLVLVPVDVSPSSWLADTGYSLHKLLGLEIFGRFAQHLRGRIEQVLGGIRYLSHWVAHLACYLELPTR